MRSQSTERPVLMTRTTNYVVFSEPRPMRSPRVVKRFSVKTNGRVMFDWLNANGYRVVGQA